jgi:chemosensory pili system protein ChpA (sensor histidine kinase/response regulator)
MLPEGIASVSEHLMRDMLYVVAISTQSNEHIGEVRRAYRLAELIPRSATRTERASRPAQLRALREQLALAKGEWAQFGAGLAAALPEFHECTARLVSHSESLNQMDLVRLLSGIANIASMLRKNPLAHNDSVALEVAMALLLAEHAADQLGQPDQAPGGEFAHQVDVMAGRLSALLRGETPESLNSWPLEEFMQQALALRHAAAIGDRGDASAEPC